jgi:hypothetical integral membrane protein (TIGR02206 family)
MSWQLEMLAIVFASIAVSLLASHERPRARKHLLVAWAYLALGYFPYMTYVELSRGVWTIEEGLPLHLCDLSAIAVGFIALRASSFETLPKSLEVPSELCFYLGTGGGLAGLFVPQVTPRDTTFLPFLVWHAALVGTPAMLIAHGLRPTLRGVGRAVLALAAIAPFVALANYLLDANYMFLMRTPRGADGILFAPPLHVFALLAIGAVSMLALWAPFALVSLRRQPSRTPQAPSPPHLPPPSPPR